MTSERSLSQINAATTAASTSSVWTCSKVIRPFFHYSAARRVPMVGFARWAKRFGSHKGGAVLWAPSMKAPWSFILPAKVPLFAAMALLCACRLEPNHSDNGQNVVEAPAPDSPVLPRQPPLDRAGLFAAVARAASAEASGADDGSAQRMLDGRQFELRLRFGCGGPSAQLRDDWLGWSFDSERRTL